MTRGTKPEPDDFNRAVMAIILSRMDATDVSQADLARKTGIPPSTLSRLLTAQKVPDIQPLRTIILALGLTMSGVMDKAEQGLD